MMNLFKRPERNNKEENLLKLREEIDRELEKVKAIQSTILELKEPEIMMRQEAPPKEEVINFVKNHNEAQQEPVQEASDLWKYLAMLNEKITITNENQLYISNQLQRVEDYLLRLPLLPKEEEGEKEEKAQLEAEEEAYEEEQPNNEEEEDDKPKPKPKGKARK